MTDELAARRAARIAVPDYVLHQEIDGASVLLNIDTETYFGLDDVGTAMWHAMARAQTLGEAAAAVAADYDAPAETVERDAIALAEKLSAHGLLTLS